MELDNIELANYVSRQLTNNFGECDSIAPYIPNSVLRVKKCFEVTLNKYYTDNTGEGVYFSPYHSGQYAIFLYILANTIHRKGDNPLLATKIYYLNKILHSVDWYYEIELPEYWGVEHPLGSVLGRAKYSNGFFFYQGCTVGGNKGMYPHMGKNVILYSNVTVLGDTRIGDNVVISTGTTIKDDIVPDSCLVFGQSPNLIIKLKDKAYMDKLISSFWVGCHDRNEGI
jgi:serine O-acetyltransferase